MEFFVAIAIVSGLFTRKLAPLMALYTLASALIGHRYWTMEGPVRLDNSIHFYRNISIVGGLLLLYVTGPGRYSVDARINLPLQFDVSNRYRTAAQPDAHLAPG
jgi:putative oxidoreductase